MRFSFLYLGNFRNYRRLELAVPEGASLFIGKNAQGKTNLLEAFYYLSSLNSPRSEKESDLAYWGEPRFTVGANVIDGQKQSTVKIETQVTPSVRRRISINDRSAKRQELPGICPCVYFSPDDLSIVKGNASVRRGFIDSILSRKDPVYAKELSKYANTVSRRNMVLKRAKEDRAWAESLRSLDQILAGLGSEIIYKRFMLIKDLAELARTSYKFISGDECDIRYVSTIGDLPGTLEDTKVMFSQNLKTLAKEELARGITLVGPHRDDVSISFDGKTFRYFGSQGQQRSMVLALKMAEARILEDAFNTKPVLLLDDVLSELDSDRRKKVVEFCDLGYQVLLTSTEASGIQDSTFSTFIVEGGSVRPV